jgi:anti-anti-sigma factor
MKCTRTDTEAESRLKLEGSLDAYTASDVRPIFDALAPDGSRRVVIDIEMLTMIDSSGIGLLVALSKRLRAGGGTFRVVNAHSQPLMVIKLLKIERLFGLEGAPGAPRS